MKKNLLLLLFILAGIVPKAFATRQTGADLSYTNLTPGVYEVTLRIYRDCYATPASSYELSAISQGCNPGRTFTMNKVGQPLRGITYCPQIPTKCDSLSRPNFDEHLYSTIITFDSTEQTCSDWVLGITFTDRNRAMTANVNGTPTMYIEAYLKLDNTINNNSPKFNKLNVAIPFVCWNQDISYTFNAVDPDGDSLAYKLVAPLTDAKTPITYNSVIGGPGGILINPKDSTQVAFMPGGMVNYSPTYPLPSYSVDWTKPMPRYATPYFDLNPVTGVVRFKPSVYYPSASSLGKNKYSVAVEVSEWRKLTAGSNVRTKIGAISREIVFIVEDCGGNKVPSTFGVVANNLQLHGSSQLIDLRPGIPLRVKVYSLDLDADSLKMQCDVAGILPGSILQIGYDSVYCPLPCPPPRPHIVFLAATIDWTPTAADVRDQPYYFNVIVNDDVCPILGYRSETIGVRVSNSGAVTSTSKEQVAANKEFIAYPNPFSQELTFKLNLKNAAQTILIYNALGQEVDRISLAGKSIGEQSIRWENASRFAAGAYVARLVGEGQAVQTIKFGKLQ